jgi:hypothetical protein
MVVEKRHFELDMSEAEVRGREGVLCDGDVGMYRQPVPWDRLIHFEFVGRENLQFLIIRMGCQRQLHRLRRVEDTKSEEENIVRYHEKRGRGGRVYQEKRRKEE